MYAGQIVEYGTSREVFYRPQHPYTKGLQLALPGHDRTRDRLIPIEGSPPDLFSPPVGCGYFARCPSAMAICQSNNPPKFVKDGGHYARCWLHHPMAGQKPAERDGLTAGVEIHSGDKYSAASTSKTVPAGVSVDNEVANFDTSNHRGVSV
jgi:oligopeptide/dipeptide ABC transporter ATP-binding protein